MNLRKILILIVSISLLAVYMIIMDPYANTGILENIPYGLALLFLVKVFLISIVCLTAFNYYMDMEMDSSYGIDEKDLSTIASQTADGAGKVLQARAMRYVASAIIILGVMIYVSGGGN